MHIKEPLLLIGKSSLCGGSGFPFSLSDWSLTICLTLYNRYIKHFLPSLLSDVHFDPILTMNASKHESDNDNSKLYNILNTSNTWNPERSTDNINQDSLNNILTVLYNSSVDIQARVDYGTESMKTYFKT